MIWTKAFWKGAGERAIKTFIQAFIGGVVTAIAGVTSGAAGAVGIEGWTQALLAALSVAVVATLGSLASSFGSANFVAGVPPVVVESKDAPAVVVNNAPVVSEDAGDIDTDNDELEDVDDSDIAPEEDLVVDEEGPLETK